MTILELLIELEATGLQFMFVDETRANLIMLFCCQRHCDASERLNGDLAWHRESLLAMCRKVPRDGMPIIHSYCL